jgi:hypothetical protein
MINGLKLFPAQLGAIKTYPKGGGKPNETR